MGDGEHVCGDEHHTRWDIYENHHQKWQTFIQLVQLKQSVCRFFRRAPETVKTATTTSTQRKQKTDMPIHNRQTLENNHHSIIFSFLNRIHIMMIKCHSNNCKSQNQIFHWPGERGAHLTWNFPLFTFHFVPSTMFIVYRAFISSIFIFIIQLLGWYLR